MTITRWGHSLWTEHPRVIHNRERAEIVANRPLWDNRLPVDVASHWLRRLEKGARRIERPDDCRFVGWTHSQWSLASL